MPGRERFMCMAPSDPAPLLFFIPLFLFAVAPSFAQDSWNINCGSNSTITIKTANGQTLFEGDGPYIRTGVSRQIPNPTSQNISDEFSTLREFPSELWKKSCYRIPVGQGTKVLVRTNHYYGNYDGQNSPPPFTVQLDASAQCSIFSGSNLNWIFCEVVYVTTKKQGTDICLIRTGSTPEGQSPFVNTIEVQKLDAKVYGLLDFSSSYLFYRSRYAFGASITKGDSYNRNWYAYDFKGNKESILTSVTRNDTTPIITKGIDDSPPVFIFDAAAVALSSDNETAANLIIPMPLLLSEPSKIYITMYFTEPFASNGKRVFHVYMGEQLVSNASQPIQPTYGDVTEFHGPIDDASNETAFKLVPAVGSTLPPAISGMEVFSRYDVLNDTDNNDGEVLSMLRDNFTVFQGWTGDPCQPEGYNWEWVGCKYPDKSSPRINKLIFSGYHLSGNIPDFRALDALEVINLSNNSFTGKVPDFLTFLPNLQTLDLSFNDFDSLPPLLLDNPNITLITRGNPKIEALVQSPPARPALISASVEVRISKFTLLVLLLIATVML